ncbi:MAG: hypothetical protein Aureis2KO_08130 [Aureisphaera sp.]
MIPIIYVLLGIFIANQNEKLGIGIALIAFGVLWFVFHPLYSKWRYKNHFKKHVEENYKNRINVPIEIDFDKNSLDARDFTSQSRISGTELKELIETKSHFFIKLTTDISLIIPKHSIENQAEFKKRVTELGAKYIDELNWEWK